MTRLLLAWVAWMSLVSAGSASLMPRKDRPTFGDEGPQLSKRSAQAVERAAARETKPPYVLTDRTEIVLNGKACPYADVPANARIVRMETAADGRTVLKVHFRTGK